MCSDQRVNRAELCVWTELEQRQSTCAHALRRCSGLDASRSDLLARWRLVEKITPSNLLRHCLVTDLTYLDRLLNSTSRDSGHDSSFSFTDEERVHR